MLSMLLLWSIAECLFQFPVWALFARPGTLPRFFLRSLDFLKGTQ